MVCPGCPEELGFGSGVVGKTPTNQRIAGSLSDGSPLATLRGADGQRRPGTWGARRRRDWGPQAALWS